MNNACWDCYLFLASKLSEGIPTTRRKHNVVVGTAVIWILIDYGKPFFVDKPPLSHILRCLRFLHQHNPNVFLERNDCGETMFDRVIRWSRDIEKTLDGGGVGEDGRCCTMHIVELILQLTPEACWVPDRDGRFPLQRVVGDYDLVQLIHKTFPRTIECRCPLTGLYAFQLASTDRIKSSLGCQCRRCEIPDRALTSAFLLLRQSPHLLVTAGSKEEGEKTAKQVELDKEELQLLRQSLEIECLKRHLANGKRAWLAKKQKLSKEGLS